MKKIKEILKERLIAILVVMIILAFTIISCLIISSNKYEDELAEVRLENKKLEYNNKELMNSVEILLNDKEAQCHCGWYEDFYYEHAEEVGAYE